MRDPVGISGFRKYQLKNEYAYYNLERDIHWMNSITTEKTCFYLSLVHHLSNINTSSIKV